MDTLTFQNRSLSDRAKRFEEALRRSTDEQIVVLHLASLAFMYLCSSDYAIYFPAYLNMCMCVFICTQEALAPYQHIEEDLKSLKEVLEMKNQQIHQQEVKISELEKLVSVTAGAKRKSKSKACLCDQTVGLYPWQQMELALKTHMPCM